MSLAGAGRSPRNHCRKAILADRRKPDSTKQAVRLALHRRKAVIRRQARPEPHKASRQACAHCRRQSPPKAKPELYKASRQACALSPRSGYTAEPLPSHPPQEIKPEQAKRKFCADTGQGTMSLAGAGGAREPIAVGNPRRRRNPNFTKQAVRLASIAARQSPPTGETRTL